MQLLHHWTKSRNFRDFTQQGTGLRDEVYCLVASSGVIFLRTSPAKLDVLLVKIESSVWCTIYHQTNLLLKGFLRTPL